MIGIDVCIFCSLLLHPLPVLTNNQTLLSRSLSLSLLASCRASFHLHPTQSLLYSTGIAVIRKDK